MKTLITLLTFIFFISCSDKPNFSGYEDIKDTNGNLLYKLNPTDSTAIVFSEYGKTYMKGKLINNKREGIWEEYVIDGNYKCYEYTFVNDIENGKCYSFTITGKIDLVGNRKDGTLNGTFVYFDLKGNPEKVEVWKEFGGGASELIYSKKLMKKITA